MSDLWTLLRDARFGVRAMAALDLLFPAAFNALGRFLVRCPKWLTKATDEDLAIVADDLTSPRRSGRDNEERNERSEPDRSPASEE